MNKCKWEYNKQYDYHEAECDECYIDNHQVRCFNYCPNCGKEIEEDK